ncbi:ribosomal RNA large subunit methyltransferase J [Coprinopsis marcescibilis]|uniref:rRNA methyltransferase 2, mitochondrial n=1 Tax=Coprinopsis marcescibilis TaxID=230819 RepID=A0A5C3L688_COPMA|nr:ribosomal RNA large subunit methyltransferase J [Coprinopsis marcescibilis]
MSLRPTLIRLAKGKTKSSTNWLARQTNDYYVRQRLSDPAAFRSRSAYKLLEINDQWDNFLAKPDVNAVVDLGAAPGGWSQVVAKSLGWHRAYASDALESDDTSFVEEEPSYGTPRNAKAGRESVFDPLAIDEESLSYVAKGHGTIIAVDLLQMQHIDGVQTLAADFLAPNTDAAIQRMLKAKGSQDGKVDVILSDMAANASGHTTRDIECSLRICEAVLDFAHRHLRTAESIGRKRGGVMLVKHFAHPELDRFRVEHLVPNFNLVKYIKPGSSRAESREGYFLCMGWRGGSL